MSENNSYFINQLNSLQRIKLEVEIVDDDGICLVYEKNPYGTVVKWEDILNLIEKLKNENQSNKEN